MGSSGGHPRPLPWLGDVAGFHRYSCPIDKEYFIWGLLLLVSLISLLELIVSIREKGMEEEGAL